MRAAFLTGYGGNEVVSHGERPDPAVDDGEGLLEVHRAGVNPVEVTLRAGLFKLRKLHFPQIMGLDVSGVVLQAPSGSGHKPGDAVYARLAGLGAYAERVAVPVSLLAHKPKAITHQEAASLPTVALTTWQSFYERAKLKSGESLLIQAGAGGIGSFAIQLAKHIGAKVTATASAANQELLKSLGADIAVDYANQRFEDAGPFDVVYDGVCGDLVVPSIKSVKAGGRYVGLVRVADERAWTETGVPAQIAADLAKGNRPYCALAAERGVEFHGPLTRADGAQLAEIAALVDAGSIKPLVSQVFGLDELAKAYDTMASQRTRGKVVIAIKD